MPLQQGIDAVPTTVCAYANHRVRRRKRLFALAQIQTESSNRVWGGQIEVEMDGRAIGNGIALRRLKGDKGLTLFYFTLISPHTGVALKQDNHGSFRLFPYSPNWNIDVYNLEMVIRLAYAIDSDNSRKFHNVCLESGAAKRAFGGI